MSIASKKVSTLPPYLFAEFQKKKEELQAKGVDVIDLGIGSPDLPTPEFIINSLIEEAKKTENHRYSPYDGCSEFKKAVAHFYQENYNVTLDPETEVLALIGSKEGLAHLMTAILDPGDGVLLPDPGYPVYSTAVHLAGAHFHPLPLQVDKGYIPDFNNIASDIVEQTKLMVLNYPGNPTAATVDIDVFDETIQFAKRNNLLVAHDSAYNLVTFDGYKAPSILQVSGAKNYAVEFGSLSKNFNMTGWRIGYLVGNKDIVQALSVLKSNLDSSQFLAIQKAAATALTSDLSTVKESSAIFAKRREKLVYALRDMGLEVEMPRGTIFIWVKVPDSFTSMSFANLVLEKAGIIVTPGSAFGSKGEGYVRIALSITTERIAEVIERLKQLDFKGVKK